MPNPKQGESKEDFLKRAIPVIMEEGKDKDQAVAIANSMYKKKGNKEMKKRLCLRGIQKKEGETKTYKALAATTHPDRVGDILSKSAIDQITQYAVIII